MGHRYAYDEEHGVSRHKIPMVGWHAGDTGALNFTDVRVPVSNLLGKEGGAIKVSIARALMQQ